MNEITQGIHGQILLEKKDLVKICSALPIKHDLRSNFLYNDALYELAGLHCRAQLRLLELGKLPA